MVYYKSIKQTYVLYEYSVYCDSFLQFGLLYFGFFSNDIVNLSIGHRQHGMWRYDEIEDYTMKKKTNTKGKLTVDE